MLAIKDHLDRALVAVSDELRADKTAASSSPASRRPRASSTPRSQRHGVTRIKSLGEPLDPHRHQAMIEMPSDQASRARSSRKCRPAI